MKLLTSQCDKYIKTVGDVPVGGIYESVYGIIVLKISEDKLLILKDDPEYLRRRNVQRGHINWTDKVIFEIDKNDYCPIKRYYGIVDEVILP